MSILREKYGETCADSCKVKRFLLLPYPNISLRGWDGGFGGFYVHEIRVTLMTCRLGLKTASKLGLNL